MSTDSALRPSPSSRQPLFLVRGVALTEMLVFFGVILAYDFLFGSGIRYLDTSLHPFWIILLLITVQYGPNESLLCAILASIFLLAGNMPEQRITETMYDYVIRTGRLPFLWIMTSLILGGIRAREQQGQEQLKERASKAEEGAETIAKAYGSLRKTKDQLELRLAEERRSVVTVYKAAQSFDMASSDKLMEAAAEMVRVTLSPIRFSIYRLHGDSLKLALAYGWPEKNTYPDVIPAGMPLYRAIVERKTALCIASARDEAVLDGAVMAGPILSPDREHVLGMLRIEEMRFSEMSIRSLETFRIICQWIGKAFIRAGRLNVHTPAPIIRAASASASPVIEQDRITRMLTALAQRQGFGMYKIAIRLVNRAEFSLTELQKISELLDKLMKDHIRDADGTLLGNRGEGIILASCRTRTDAQRLILRLENSLSQQGGPLLARARHEFTLDTMYDLNPAESAPADTNSTFWQ